jgi:hydrogenase maturation protease
MDQIAQSLAGRVCLVGVGNRELGDDAFGVRVAEDLQGKTRAEVIVAETSPERHVPRMVDGRFDCVLFVDAVEFEGEPGAAIWMDAPEVRSRFPQISTHKISLGTLADLIERESASKVYLLGVKPQSLKPSTGLSTPVHRSQSIVVNALAATLGREGRGRA